MISFKKLAIIPLVILGGCDGFDFSLDCRITDNRLTCNYDETDGGVEDAEVPVADASTDSAVEPTKDASADATVKDTGVPDSAVDSGVKDAAVDTGVVDSGGPVVVPGNRPAASKGTGPFVVGKNLYDGNGKPLRLVGDNKLHPDFWMPYMKTAPINAMRWQLYFDDPARNVSDLTSTNVGGSIADKDIVVPSWWDATCKGDRAPFEAIVARWVRGMSRFNTLERNMILNIANEASMGDADWQAWYVDAVQRIRAAGWNGMILVDANGCGQNPDVIINRGQAVFNADPQKNTGFSVHLYGNWKDTPSGNVPSWNPPFELTTKMAQLGATGLFVMIGEVGPGVGDNGQPIGPSATPITARRFIDVAAQQGITSYLTWAFDDNDQSNAGCSNNWFCMANPINSNPPVLNSWGREAIKLWTRDNPGKARTF